MHHSHHPYQLAPIALAIATALAPGDGRAATYDSGLLDFTSFDNFLWGPGQVTGTQVPAQFVGATIPSFTFSAGPGISNVEVLGADLGRNGAEVSAGMLGQGKVGFNLTGGVNPGTVDASYGVYATLSLPDDPLAPGSYYSFTGSSMVDTNTTLLNSTFAGVYYNYDLILKLPNLFIGGEICALGDCSGGRSDPVSIDPGPIKLFAYDSQAPSDARFTNFGVTQPDPVLDAPIDIVAGPEVAPNVDVGIKLGSVTLHGLSDKNIATTQVDSNGRLSGDSRSSLFTASVDLAPLAQLATGLFQLGPVNAQFSVGPFSAGYTLFSLNADTDLNLEQRLRLDARPSVTLAFDHPLSVDAPLRDGNRYVTTGDRFTVPLNKLNDYKFQFDQDTVVTPTFSLDNRFSNTSNLVITETLTLEVLKAFVDLGIDSYDFTAYSQQLLTDDLASFNIVNTAYSLPFAPMQRDPFTIRVGDSGGGPPIASHSATWEGQGGDNSWSTSANWKDNQVPVNGDTLLFDSTTTGRALAFDNNINTVNGLSFLHGATGFVLQGNDLITTGAILNQSDALQTIQQNLTLGADQLWDGGAAGLKVTGDLDLAGNNLTMAGVNLTNHQTLVVAKTGTGVLDIGGASVVAVDRLLIGQKPGSFGQVYVEGGSSATMNQLTVGEGGAGELLVFGGQVRTVDADLATLSGSSAYVDISGSGSSLTTTGQAHLAEAGNLILAVEYGGRLSTQDATIAAQSTANAKIDVRGAGSEWRVGNQLDAAGAGKATLTVSDGGLLAVGTPSHDGRFLLGGATGPGAELRVETGGLADVSGDLRIGATGRVFLTGAANTDPTLLKVSGATDLAAGGRMTLTDASPEFDGGLHIAGTLTSGGNSQILGSISLDGDLVVQNGRLALSSDTVSHAGANLLVNTGATLANSGALTNEAGAVLTNNGTFTNAGTVKIAAGGSIDGTGTYTQTAGTTTVDGSLQQSMVDIEGGVLRDHGAIAADRLMIGVNPNSLGQVYVEGTGASVAVDRLIVGNEGRGNLYVRSGGQVEAVDAQFAVKANSRAFLEVAGPSSLLGPIVIGTPGSGTPASGADPALGGNLSVRNATLAADATAEARVQVHGAGAEWTVANQLNAAGAGRAELNVFDGGRLTVGDPSHQGLFLLGGIDGPGALLGVASGGLVSVFGDLRIGATGAILLNGGLPGTDPTLLKVSGLTDLGRGAQLTLTDASPEFDGGLHVAGTLTSNGNSQVLGPISLDGELVVQNGRLALGNTIAHRGAETQVNAGATLANTGTFDNRSGAVLTNNGTLVNQAGALLTNNGTLANQAGASLDDQGRLTNHGTVTNAGTVHIAAGGLLDGTGTYTQTAGTTTVDGLLEQADIDIEGGTLKGDGTITGPVTIAAGAFLSPGNSPGTLTVNGDLALAGTLLMEFAGIGPGTFDVLDVHGGVTFGLDSLIAFDLSALSGFASGMFWDFLLADFDFSGLDRLHYQLYGLPSGWGYRIDDLLVGGRHELELRLTAAPGPVDPPSAVPEIDASSGTAALVLLLCAVSLAAERRRAVPPRSDKLVHGS